MLKREHWSIGSTFGYAIRVLNSIFCSDLKEEDIYETDNKWLVAEQVNSLCSRMMIEDAEEIISMVLSIPDQRMCERTDCIFHHPKKHATHDYSIFQDKCDECIHNNHVPIRKNKPKRDMEHYESN